METVESLSLNSIKRKWKHMIESRWKPVKNTTCQRFGYTEEYIQYMHDIGIFIGKLNWHLLRKMLSAHVNIDN